MNFDPDLHFITRGYTQRVAPEYFVDTEESGITWQPDVYPEVLALARKHGRTVIIDLGCGRAGKLAGLREQNPNLDIIGIDFGPNIDWCRKHLPFGRWLAADLELSTTLPLVNEVVARSVVVCSDVLEHLIEFMCSRGPLVCARCSDSCRSATTQDVLGHSHAGPQGLDDAAEH